MAYETQPGTLPHRAVEHLKAKPAGTELATAAFCEALEVPAHAAKAFTTWMQPVRKAGLVKARTKPGQGRTLFWSLGDGQPEVDSSEEDEREDTPAETNEVVPFNAAAWADGDVDLYGLIPLEDGGHRMTADMLAKLKRLVTWMPAP